MKDTENKIQHLLQPDAVNADTSAVLVNALYFKGKFKKPFTPESTMSDDFYVDQDRHVEVDMMYQEDKFKYIELPEVDARAVQLPYEDSNISLLIILPNKTTGLLDLERNLKTIDLADIESRMTMEDVEIAMPRFSLEFDLDLRETLQELGISKLFDDSADLSRLFTTPTGQKISAAKHRGYIKVNEAGSEAAAVTFMKMVPMSLNMQKKTFKVDHPFIFFIHNPKAVFFAGRFVEPQKNKSSTCDDGLKSISESMRVEMSQMFSRKSD
ncbi:alaserpin-like isoform X2 [Drosophila innubila]|nr:alaserpin-like isoform X2 [Drosophila innubila]